MSSTSSVWLIDSRPELAWLRLRCER